MQYLKVKRLKTIYIKAGYAEVSEKIGKLKLEAPGENVAGNARKELERRSGRKVSTKQNYLIQPQNPKLLEE